MNDYTEYFPLRTTAQIRGAYDFLMDHGLGEQVECIKNVGYNPNTKRLMVVGLLFDKKLVDTFFSEIWTQADPNYQEYFMDKYYQRYQKRPDLHGFWH